MKYGVLNQGNVESDGDLFFQLAAGDESERPDIPTNGMLRYNTELEAANVGDFSGFGRYEAYIDGQWTPLVSMVDFVNPEDLYGSGNVTLKVLADMIRDFFVQGMGMIELNQNQIWQAGSSFGTTPLLSDAIDPANKKFFDPMTATGSPGVKVQTPSYLSNVNYSGSNPGTPALQAGGILNNKLVQQIQPLLEPVIGDGMIHEVNIINGGSGYTDPPRVMINTGGGDGAVAQLIVDLNAASPTYGQITQALVSEQGDGYRSGGLTKAYLKGGGGEDAVIDVNVVSGKLTSLTITNPGKNYVSAPTITFADGGTRGYISAEVTGGSVTKLNVLSRGIDYSNSASYRPTIEFVSEDPGVTPAQATVSLGDGKLIEVKVLRGGSGYVTTPLLEVLGNHSTRAVATIDATQLDGGVVTGVSITDHGTGYSPTDSTLAVTISAADASSNAIVVSSKNAVDFSFNFDFDIFPACGLPTSQRKNYKLGLFNCLYKVLPHYGHDPYNQQYYQSISLIPKWDATKPLLEQVNHNDYGKYTGNMFLQGERAYYVGSTGSVWFGNLTKFQGF